MLFAGCNLEFALTTFVLFRNTGSYKRTNWHLFSFYATFGLCLLSLVCVLAQTADAGASPSNDQGLRFQALLNVPAEVGISEICCSGTYTFRSPPVTQLRTGYANHIIWLKVHVDDARDIIQLKPTLDDVTLYARSESQNGWIVARTGDMIPIAEKTLRSPFMALPLPETGSDPAVYIRVDQQTAVAISIYQWSAADFQAFQDDDWAMKSYLYGFISAMILYNIFVSLAVRDAAFLANALAVGSLLTASLYLSGYGATYVWHAWPGWSNAIQMAAFFFTVNFGSLFMWLFVRHADDRLMDHGLLMVAPAIAVFAALCAMFFPVWVVQIFMLAGSAVFIVMTTIHMVRLALKGDEKAKIMLIPMIAAVYPGVMLVALEKIAGLQSRYSGANVLEITLCVEALLFSLALAWRIRVTERDAQAAKADLVSVRNESLARTIAAQDAERHRMAKELHDGVAQDFLVVVGSLKRLAHDDQIAKWRSAVPALINSANSALDEVRRISRDMYPASIVHLGLGDALQALFEALESAYQIETEVHLSFDDSRLDTDARLHIYRIVQECLSNISRHSGASVCRAIAIERGSKLHLSIEDDGTGLDRETGHQTQQSGLGFTSIGERVRALKGDWKMGSGDLGGLKIEFVLPLTAIKTATAHGAMS